MNRSHRLVSRLHRLVGVVAFLLLILAACGRSDSAPTASEPAQPTSADVEQAEPLAEEPVVVEQKVEVEKEVELTDSEYGAEHDDNAEPLSRNSIEEAAEEAPAEPEPAEPEPVQKGVVDTTETTTEEEVVLESDRRAKDDDGSTAGRTDWSSDDETGYYDADESYDYEDGDSYRAESAPDTMASGGATERDLGGGGGLTADSMDGYGATEPDAHPAPPSKPTRRQQQAPLRAGEIDDNAKWDDYLFYRRTYQGPYVHNLDVTERYIIDVRDEQGRPVLDAQVRVMAADQQGQGQTLYQANTYATGQTLFHPQAVGINNQYDDAFEVEVSKGKAVESFILTRADYQASQQISERWLVKLADAPAPPRRIKLDLLFLIDATGSMDDEISKVQDTVFDVTARIDALPGQPQVHYGMVTYRDRDDAFVSRTYPFTPDVREFADNLDTVYADGGGDYPESLNEALHKSIHDMSWRQSDTIKLVILIADAPPHLDYAQDYDYAEEMVIAAEQGIKIFPIASSGLDDQGEYIFRQLAQFTQGRFIFLTYADGSNSGAPGSTTTHHVDDYTVEHLDDLLVQLVTEELAHQNPQLGRR
ncbi:VWA domain-containing protein [Anaerolineales bacterium HSG25]|nr:VWA domain-containing protein [Anaerolineales bacterium HSG25]